MLALLAATTVPMVVGTLAGLALLGLHRERLALLALVPALVLKIVACLIWVPTGGALAAAAISLVVECALATALLLALCRALREAGVAWRVTAADMAAWMAAAVWPALVANAWPGDGAARVLVAAIAVVLGAGLAWALMPGRLLRQAWRAVHPDIDGRPAQEPH
jgi:O-antigen/teichoic acid export membrane protein